MVTLTYIVIIVYMIVLSLIMIYTLGQLHLLYLYGRFGKKKINQQFALVEAAPETSEVPFVTVQLPIYNELYVIERLIDSVCKFDYPKECFEIHILDDSTDETVEVVKNKVEEYQKKGFNIEQITRIKRTGYKAGALKDAMQFAKGEFIAIFDADFLPQPDFLRKTILHFNNPDIGVVQTRWEHINQDYSLLTRLQAIHLDVHFTIEQNGRYAGNCLLQFNGTGGVWRRKAIDEAGGWEADTLTEDLDLSYRAQLKGWRIVYLENFTSPAELPAEMNGLKSQQFRWTKGGAETARKMLPIVWRSKLSFGRKFHASLHLLGSSVFVLVFIGTLLSVPFFLLKDHMVGIPLHYASIFYVSLISLTLVYYTANVETLNQESTYIKRLLKFIALYPLFLTLSIGLSLHNTIAVIQGYVGKKSAFIRTPKFNIKGLTDTFRKKNYLSSKLSWVTFFEGLLCLYFGLTVLYGIRIGDTSLLPYHLMYTLGFGAIFYYSISHLRFKS